MSHRALIVDDHPIIRSTLVTTLVSLGVFDDVEAAGSFQELLQKLEHDAAYQLLILDLSLTDISGSDGVVYIREHYADVPVVIFSASDSIDVVAQCFESGVHGFVSKNSPMQTFVDAIQIVLAGGTYIPPSTARLMGFVPQQFDHLGVMQLEEKIHFSPRQRQVFEQLIQGVPNKVIARQLDMAEGTVKTHLHSIYLVLGVSNRAQAILKSQQLNLTE